MNQLPPESFQHFEEFYKQGLLSTASVPRMVILLYERLEKSLEQAIRCVSDPNSHRQSVEMSQQILNHLLKIFMQSDDHAYDQLYLSHEQLAQKLAKSSKSADSSQLAECLNIIKTYHQSWRQQQQIKRRHLRTSQTPPLNVRRNEKK